MLRLGVRAKVAAAAAIATVLLLSAFGTAGYLVMVDATRRSQVDALNTRLDEFSARPIGDEDLRIARLGVDGSIRVVPAGSELPPQNPNTLRVVRDHPDPDIQAIVGIADTSRIDATFDTIRIALWVSILFTGLVVGSIAWAIVGRALRPVRELTVQAQANISSRSADLLPVDESGDEMAELATTLNTMLVRLRGVDAERRRFVSDASHELRTPLMVLSADAEFAHDRTATDGPASDLAASVLTQTKRLTGLVDDLLTLASIDEDHRPTSDALPVSEVLRKADAVSLVPNLSPAVSGALIPNVSRSVANVLANARRHSIERVTLDVRLADSVVTITIDDDGPGIPIDERDHVFARFYRPDEGRARRDGGAGLGLAIARSEMKQVLGGVTVDDSPLGGARFTLTVPVRATNAAHTGGSPESLA